MISLYIFHVPFWETSLPHGRPWVSVSQISALTGYWIEKVSKWLESSYHLHADILWYPSACFLKAEEIKPTPQHFITVIQANWSVAIHLFGHGCLYRESLDGDLRTFWTRKRALCSPPWCSWVPQADGWRGAAGEGGQQQGAHPGSLPTSFVVWTSHVSFCSSALASTNGG